MSFKTIFNYLVGTPRYLELNRDPIDFPRWAVHLRRSGFYASIVSGSIVGVYAHQVEDNGALESGGWGMVTAGALYVFEDRRKKRQQAALTQKFGGEKCIDTRPEDRLRTSSADLQVVREEREALIYGTPLVGGSLLAVGWAISNPLIPAFVVPEMVMSAEEIVEYNRILSRKWAIIPRVKIQEFVEEKNLSPQAGLHHP